MALLRWTELSWDEFVTGLEGFRDYYRVLAVADMR